MIRHIYGNRLLVAGHVSGLTQNPIKKAPAVAMPGLSLCSLSLSMDLETHTACSLDDDCIFVQYEGE